MRARSEISGASDSTWMNDGGRGSLATITESSFQQTRKRVETAIFAVVYLLLQDTDAYVKYTLFALFWEWVQLFAFAIHTVVRSPLVVRSTVSDERAVVRFGGEAGDGCDDHGT